VSRDADRGIGNRDDLALEYAQAPISGRRPVRSAVGIGAGGGCWIVVMARDSSTECEESRLASRLAGSWFAAVGYRGLVGATSIPLFGNEYEAKTHDTVDTGERHGFHAKRSASVRHFGQPYQSMSTWRDALLSAGRVVVSSTIWSLSVHVMEIRTEDQRA
jgi:hypothetical protein